MYTVFLFSQFSVGNNFWFPMNDLFRFNILPLLISAYKAALFFAINPASIFFSAPYSESLNAMLTFSALSRFTKGFSAKSCIAVSLASATRANSILNAGFVVYHSLKIVATEMIMFVRY